MDIFFTLVHFLLLLFPFVFLFTTPLSSMFIASDSKLPHDNPVMIAAMIPASMRPFKQAQR